jgi:DNA-binding transcriptional ArsR family regulator
VVVSFSPQHTLYVRMSRAGRTGPRAAAGRPRAVLGEHAFALRPLLAPASSVPDVVVPIEHRPDVPVCEQVEALHDYPEKRVRADIVTTCSQLRAWEPVAQDPRRWMRAYAGLTRASWQRMQPLWHSARHLLERESERVGAAVVRGATDTLLNTLSPRLRYLDGSFVIDGRRECPLDGRRLILVPSLIPADTLVLHHARPDVVSLAYPVRGQGSTSVPPPATHDRLTLVLGPARAALLRVLTVPLTIGAVAAHLDVTPAAASRHCDHLERAGLLTRERRGQSVYVSRTEQGWQVLDLLANPR